MATSARVIWLSFGPEAFGGIISHRIPSRLKGGCSHNWLPHKFGLLFGGFAFVFALAERLQLLFTALGAFGGALHQFGAHQFDHGLLGAVALAISQAHDPRIA